MKTKQHAARINQRFTLCFPDSFFATKRRIRVRVLHILNDLIIKLCCRFVMLGSSSVATSRGLWTIFGTTNRDVASEPEGTSANQLYGHLHLIMLSVLLFMGCIFCRVVLWSILWSVANHTERPHYIGSARREKSDVLIRKLDMVFVKRLPSGLVNLCAR